MARVPTLRNWSPLMVEPMARPRNSVTTLASSLAEAFVSRSTTLDSRIRLPSMSDPMSGVANGTRTPTMTVTMMGNRMRVRALISREVYGIRIARSFFVVSSRMTGGMMSGTSDM